MSSKRRGFQRRHGGVGPSSWRTSVAKATNAWKQPKKSRTQRAKKGWS